MLFKKKSEILVMFKCILDLFSTKMHLNQEKNRLNISMQLECDELIIKPVFNSIF